MSTREHNAAIAILASGSGSTAEAFIHAAQDGQIAAEVGLVVCNNPPERAGIYERIGRLNARYGLDIEVLEISGRTHPEGNVGRGQTLAESEAICEAVMRRGITLVALMGYMKVVRGALIEVYGWRPDHDSVYDARMLNTHPGPLPETADTYGIYTSRRVLELGMTSSRHTVHLVAEGVDRGPIIAEHHVDVLPDDTAEILFDRVQNVEKRELPRAIGNFLHEQGGYRGNS